MKTFNLNYGNIVFYIVFILFTFTQGLYLLPGFKCLDTYNNRYNDGTERQISKSILGTASSIIPVIFIISSGKLHQQSFKPQCAWDPYTNAWISLLVQSVLWLLIAIFIKKILNSHKRLRSVVWSFLIFQIFLSIIVFILGVTFQEGLFDSKNPIIRIVSIIYALPTIIIGFPELTLFNRIFGG